MNGFAAQLVSWSLQFVRLRSRLAKPMVNPQCFRLNIKRDKPCQIGAGLGILKPTISNF